MACGILQVAASLPAGVGRAIAVDPAVAEVPDQEVVAEALPATGGPGEAPRRVQVATGRNAANQPLDQIAATESVVFVMKAGKVYKNVAPR